MTSWRSSTPFVFAALMLPLGLVIGGLGPRQEVRSLREALEAAPTECEDRGAMGREIARVFRGDPLGYRLPAPSAAEAPAPTGAPPDPGAAGVAPPDVEAPPLVQPEIGDDMPPEEAMKLAREGLALRAAQARAALAEAGATEAQLAGVDAAMNAMNEDLASLTEEFVSTLEAGEEPDRRQMMIFASDTLDVLLTAEDSLYGTFDAEQRAALDEAALDPFSYVDARVLDQLSKLEGLR